MIQYEFDEARSLAFVTISGELDDTGAIAWLTDFAEAMQQFTRVGGVVDTRPLTRFDVSSSGVAELTRIAQASDDRFAGSRWAIVADQDVVFGMSRMFEMLRGGAPYEIKVLRSMEDALRWVEATP